MAPAWGLRTTSLLYVAFVGSLSLSLPALAHAALSQAGGPTGRDTASPRGADALTARTGRSLPMPRPAASSRRSRRRVPRS
ncbi:hypothetical protein SHL15_0330 [Streptomyces hygroscopicus subsp. limoneus]|nr:hypothetical protein SHL15_0330 [Streptomyces hygroscopicus subsp. limoneus]